MRFEPEPTAGGWDPAVETFQVWEGNERIGRIYLDMHPRKGKYSHANMVPVLVRGDGEGGSGGSSQNLRVREKLSTRMP